MSKRKTYALTNGNIRVTDLRQLTNGSIVPNYVVDLYLPIIGANGLGVLTTLYRLANNSEIIVNLTKLSRACRMGKRKLNSILDLLEKCDIVEVNKPTGQKRLKHFRTEITLLDPPVSVPASYADVVADRMLVKWLVRDIEIFEQVEPTNSNGKQKVIKSEQDDLFKVIVETFKTAPGQTRAIHNQMTGRTSKKNLNHISDFDPPATPNEVSQFVDWWKAKYPTLNLPTSPPKLQSYFYAFRAEGPKKPKRRIEWETETTGRWLEFDDSNQRWMDKGAAKSEEGCVFVWIYGEWKEIKKKGTEK